MNELIKTEPQSPQKPVVNLPALASGRHLSNQALSVVRAREEGTPLVNAQESQLEAVWNEIVGLLGIRHTRDSYDEFLDDLRNLNDWMLREYPGITCEEIRLAYNLAVKGELSTKDKPLEVFPILAPRYVGEVLSAYRRKVNEDPEVMAVYRSQQHLPEPTEPTAEEIDTFMENVLNQAIETVKQGEQYPDLGAGLYDWLDSKGRIPFNKEQKIGFWNRAADELVWEVADGTGTTQMHPNDRNKRLKDISGLIKGQLTPSAENRLRDRAKCLALNHYLVSLIPESELVTTSKLKTTSKLF